jgi:hypothetical protein
MALTEEHRSSIYRSLVPILGEEEAEAMVSQFPASDADELVTKAFLRAELAELRAETAGLEGNITAEVYRLSSRIIMWLVSTIVAVGGLIVAAIAIVG